MIRIIWNEVKQTKVIIILFAIILTILMTVSSVFSIVSFKCLNEVDNIKNQFLQDPITFQIQNIGSVSLKNIDSMNFSYVDIEFDYSEFFEKNVSLYTKNGPLNENLSYVRRNDSVYYELMKNSILKGKEFCDPDISADGYYPVWVSKSIAMKNNFNCEDIIYLESVENDTVNLKIEGIYSDAVNIPDIFTNISSFEDVFRTFNISTRKIAFAVNYSYKESKKIALKLDSFGISYSSNITQIDDYLNYYYNILIILFTLSIMIMGISLILFFTYIRLILSKRDHYISLLLILGMPVRKIVSIYSLIMESMVFLSASLSALAMSGLYKFVEEMMKHMTGMNFELSSFSVSALIFMVAVMSIFILANSVFLYIKLKKFKETDVIRGKE